MNSEEMNKIITYYIEDTDEPRYLVKGLRGTGKTLPYAGIGWRDVRFDTHRMWLSHVEGRWWGFDVAGKWPYLTYQCKPSEIIQIKSLVVQALLDPSNHNFQLVFDYMQQIPKAEEAS